MKRIFTDMYDMFLIKFFKKKILTEDVADDKKFDKYFKHRRDDILKANPEGSLPPNYLIDF
jgi:hypothetical protein